MADPTFFDLFKSTWAQNGLTEGITDLQYKTGWSYIGSVPPSVEQFNKVQQTTDERLSWLYKQLDGLAAVTGRPLQEGGSDALSHAIQNLDAGNVKTGTLPVARGGSGLATVPAGSFLTGNGTGAYAARTAAQVLTDIGAAPLLSAALAGAPTAPTPPSADRSTRLATTAFVAGNFPRIFSITALPTEDIGPIIVAECSEIWIWSASSYFNGYRSPICGRPLDGHTITPLPSEIDAVGGVLPKAAYAGLWGYARENSLVVSQATWTANPGAHYFVDVDANQFRVPDLRNMFRRFTGTDADTANARVLGSLQRDAMQNGTGTLQGRPIPSAWGAITAASGAFSLTSRGGGPGASTLLTSDNSPANADLVTFDLSRVARTSGETRPANAAYCPRIHA
ncbi:hypothetical protein [Achromobacter sp. UMC46]|uniref:hypothetical protein n=1 Tax=Achromobacter sp. UMC46 TaxID=1862319 RepID=UPI00160347A5|nr:hypothetical protein [Achromobacter sp. UMC46]MBB1593533.1 hypothetical protein [Achromobacter sp. UMC46]